MPMREPVRVMRSMSALFFAFLFAFRWARAFHSFIAQLISLLALLRFVIRLDAVIFCAGAALERARYL
jgi:hypothetical protein